VGEGLRNSHFNVTSDAKELGPNKEDALQTQTSSSPPYSKEVNAKLKLMEPSLFGS
jgi:hypothetical protein